MYNINEKKYLVFEDEIKNKQKRKRTATEREEMRARMRELDEKSNAEAEERQINGGNIASSDVALHVTKSGCVVYEVFVIGVGLWLCFQCALSLCFLLLKHLPARTTWLPFECDRYCQNGMLIIFIA